MLLHCEPEVFSDHFGSGKTICRIRGLLAVCRVQCATSCGARDERPRGTEN